MVCDRTSTIRYSMFFKAILKFLDFLETNEILVGNTLFFNGLRILVSVSTKNKYSILIYISSLLVLDNQNNIVAWV